MAPPAFFFWLHELKKLHPSGKKCNLCNSCNLAKKRNLRNGLRHFCRLLLLHSSSRQHSSSSTAADSTAAAAQQHYPATSSFLYTAVVGVGRKHFCDPAGLFCAEKLLKSFFFFLGRFSYENIFRITKPVIFGLKYGTLSGIFQDTLGHFSCK